MPIPAYPTTYLEQGVEKPITNPSLPIEEGVKMNVLAQERDSGHEQRRQKGDPRRTFSFSYNALPSLAAQAIFDFFLQMQGSVKSFTWAHPATKIQYTVRFDMETFSKEYIHHNFKGPIYKLSVKLIQVL